MNDQCSFALQHALSALDSVWAAIGDRLLAKGPLDKGYAQAVLEDVNVARERIKKDLASECHKSGGWIACRDQMPAANQIVIVEGGVAYRARDGDWYTITGYAWPGLRIGWDIKHWMPLPMPDGLTCSGVNFNDFSEPHKPGPSVCTICGGAIKLLEQSVDERGGKAHADCALHSERTEND